MMDIKNGIYFSKSDGGKGNKIIKGNNLKSGEKLKTGKEELQLHINIRDTLFRIST